MKSNHLIGLCAPAALCAALSMPIADAHALSMVESNGINNAESLAGARLRDFLGGSNGAVLGIPPYEPGGLVTSDIQWASSNQINWTLEPAEDRLSLSIENENGQWMLQYDDWSASVAALTSGIYHQADLNVLILDIWNRDNEESALITLSDVRIDDQPLGSFSAVHGLSPPRERRAILGHCFGTVQGFELTATLELANLTMTQGELDRVTLQAGVDPDMGLNCAQPANLTASVDPQQVTLFRGQEAVIGVTLSNAGSGPALATSVNLVEPADVTMTDALAACGSSEPGTLTCPIGEISADENFYFEFTIRADDEAPFGSRQFEVQFSTESVNLNPINSAIIDVIIANDIDRVFSDRYQVINP